MPMNSRDFPFVWMSFSHAPGHDHDHDFEEFERNLTKGEPFVILSDQAPEDDHEHSPEEKKRTALWMKRHKAELRQLVMGLIVVEPNAAKRLALKTFGIAFAKFWGYPLLTAANRTEALTLGRELLAQKMMQHSSVDNSSSS